jgi:predicted ATPase/class 3 adenylate cyclase
MAETAEQPASIPATTTTLLTFLIADVRGYTRFTNERGDEAAARLADRFAALCEQEVGRHEGEVIELRGDEALAVFSSARNALRGAVALQQAFKEAVAADSSLPLTVGMGLDAGEPIPIRGGYRGGALNLAARLCSIAGAGDILASEGVVHLARKTEGLAFVDRGQVTLKGLASPVRVLQIAPEGELPEELPPLQPILVTHPTNLPDEPTAFIGREDEIVRIVRLVREPKGRLVTLTGPGGTGKTRLALQVGNSLLYDFGDGVFFCDLSPLAEADLVPAAIAEVLGLKQEADKSISETLIEALREKHLLLVLDNFEHLLDACQEVASLLDACRDLHVLVTSRIPLHLSREREHAVPSLQLPDLQHLPDTAALSQYDSVALFIQRARAANDSFAITDENAPAVAEICSRLDGLPLAIELAAARVKLFPPQALLQRLDRRLNLLTGGARDRPTRQQTLRGAIEWSYSLLTEEEQALFTRLSVFVGGCSFEASEVVCNPHGSLDVLEGMSSLVDKSLVRQEGDAEPRFVMLETIREYAAEKLAERGEEGEARAAHAAYFVQLAEEADPELRGPRYLEWIRRLEAEVPNIWASVQYLLDQNRVADAIRLLTALNDFWVGRIHIVEAVRWVEDILRRLDDRVPPGLRGRALWEFAVLTSWIWWGTTERQRPLIRYQEQALPLLKEGGEVQVYGRALNGLANLLLAIGDHRAAEDRYRQSLATAREIGDHRGVGIALLNLGLLAVNQGDEETAFRYLEEATPILRAVGDGNVLAMQLFDLGALRVVRGELDEARTCLEECLPMFETLQRPNWIALTLQGLGLLDLKQGKLDLAEARLRQAFTDFIRDGVAAYGVEALGTIAALALERGESGRAGVLLGAMLQLRQSLGVAPTSALSLEHPRTMQRVREALGEEAWERAQGRGAAMGLQEVVEFALGNAAKVR